MLIALGGLWGSGRTMLARKLAQRLGFFYYDVEQKKISKYAFNKQGQVKEQVQQPNTDEMRLFVYKKILEDLPLLSKMYTGVVLDDSFHRAKPREYLFREAGKHFDPIRFVWIDSDEEHIADRLEMMRLMGKIKSVRWALQNRARQEGEFEPPSPPPLTFHHALSNDKAAARLVELIRTVAPEITDITKTPA